MRRGERQTGAQDALDGAQGATAPPEPSGREASGRDRPVPGAMSGQVARGVGWVGMARLGAQAAQFIAGLFLARLLTPEEFGVVASVAVISGFAVIFFELGIGASLIYLRPLTEEDLATAFWLNALAGLGFVALLAALGPVLARFFDQSELIYLSPLLGLSFALSLGVCHRALLDRQLQFRAVAIMQVIAAVLGYGTSVALAAAGVGPVALAMAPVVQSAAMTIGLWSRVPWRPRYWIVRSSLPKIWRFSSGMLGFNAVAYWARNADNLLIGRVLGASALGYYNRAYSLMLLPVQQVSAMLGRVMFPALSSIQDDHARVASAYRRAVRAINMTSVPLLVGMAVTAPGLVPLLWGPAWERTVPLLQVLAIAGVPQCMASSVGWLFQSQGRTRLMFATGVANAAVIVTAIVVGLRWDSMGVAVGVLVSVWILTPPTLHVACRLVGLSAGRVLLDNVPTILTALLMGLVVWFLPLLLGLERDHALVVPVQIAAGALVYGVGIRLAQPAAFAELRTLLGSLTTR